MPTNQSQFFNVMPVKRICDVNFIFRSWDVFVCARLPLFTPGTESVLIHWKRSIWFCLHLLLIQMYFNKYFLNICTGTHYTHFWNYHGYSILHHVNVTSVLLNIQSVKLETLICLLIMEFLMWCRTIWSLWCLLQHELRNFCQANRTVKLIDVGSQSYSVVQNDFCFQ